MNNLLNFFVKHSAWFVFMVYMILSLVLLFRDNPWQQSVYLTSANSVTSATYEAMSAVTSYFHLRDINDDLQERNALLEMEVVSLRDRVKDLQMLLSDSAINQLPVMQHFDFVMARVISNSIAQPHNYITINRGYNQGVRPQMGVVDQNGVVGVVNVVGPNSARVISLLNTDLMISCRLKNEEAFGPLTWDGRSPEYAVLREIPKHITYHAGDTVLTSGFSDMFPEGLIVGTVVGKAKVDDDNFASLRVKLTTNFSQLSTVRVITNSMSEELRQLESNTNADSIKARVHAEAEAQAKARAKAKAKAQAQAEAKAKAKADTARKEVAP